MSNMTKEATMNENTQEKSGLAKSLATGAKPFFTFALCALVIALIGHFAFKVAGNLGILQYSYRVAESPIALAGTLFDKLCVVLTGSTFVGFLFVAGLTLSVSCGLVLLYAYLARTREGFGSPALALIWGVCAFLLSLICGAVAALGLFSGVQISLVAGSAGGGGGSTGRVALLVLLAVSTLIAAACEVARRCLGVKREGRVSMRLVLWVAVASAVVAVLTVGSFGAMNAAVTNFATEAAWLCASVLANCIILLVASRKPSENAE